MAGEQNSFDVEANPVVGKIREGYPPFFLVAVGMTFIHKPIDSLKLANVTLIVLAVLLDM